jgi:hypothetical protein
MVKICWHTFYLTFKPKLELPPSEGYPTLTLARGFRLLSRSQCQQWHSDGRVWTHNQALACCNLRCSRALFNEQKSGQKCTALETLEEPEDGS